MQNDDKRLSGSVTLTELADALIGIQEDMPSADVRDTLGMAAHYLRKFAALTNEPQGARKPSAWRVCWVSLNTSRTELFEDYAKATGKARETGGCVIPLHPERGPNEVS